VILNGCETWSLTVREEHRLRVFENRVLRMIFGPKRNLMTGERRKLHKEETGQNTSTIALRVVIGDEKGTQCPGV
jgi:hypothetical protein